MYKLVSQPCHGEGMKQGEALGGQHLQLKSNLKQLIIQYSLILIDHSAIYLSIIDYCVKNECVYYLSLAASVSWSLTS